MYHVTHRDKAWHRDYITHEWELDKYQLEQLQVQFSKRVTIWLSAIVSTVLGLFCTLSTVAAIHGNKSSTAGDIVLLVCMELIIVVLVSGFFYNPLRLVLSKTPENATIIREDDIRIQLLSWDHQYADGVQHHIEHLEHEIEMLRNGKYGDSKHTAHQIESLDRRIQGYQEKASNPLADIALGDRRIELGAWDDTATPLGLLLDPLVSDYMHRTELLALSYESEVSPEIKRMLMTRILEIAHETNEALDDATDRFNSGEPEQASVVIDNALGIQRVEAIERQFVVEMNDMAARDALGASRRSVES